MPGRTRLRGQAESIPFVAQFLNSSDDEVAEGAALALSESRRPEALEILKKHWPKARRGAIQNVLLLAIAITRLPAAVDFLMEVLAEKNEATAAAALTALAIHKHNPAIRERISAVIEKKGVAELRQRFAKEFPEARP